MSIQNDLDFPNRFQELQSFLTEFRSKMPKSLGFDPKKTQGDTKNQGAVRSSDARTAMNCSLELSVTWRLRRRSQVMSHSSSWCQSENCCWIAGWFFWMVFLIILTWLLGGLM